MNMKFQCFALLQLSMSLANAFTSCDIVNAKKISRVPLASSWGVADDWSKLSNKENNADSLSTMYNIDLVSEAADKMSRGADTFSEYEPSDSDEKIIEALDTIYSQIVDLEGPNLYDTTEVREDADNTLKLLDEIGREISLLIRCNESPDDLLIETGRKLPAITPEEIYESSQLLKKNANGDLRPTDFFISSVRAIFHLHATSVPSSDGKGKELVLTRDGISSWMTRSLGEKVGDHDKRITVVLAKYSTYGSGVITLREFENLYVDAASRSMVQKKVGKKKVKSIPNIKSVWRDLENHGFMPPVLEDRKREQQLIDERYGTMKDSSGTITVDECEILEWRDDEHSSPRESSNSQMEGASSDTKKSSHELIPLLADGKTPGRIRDGEFVFIDEESCIGCKQCVNTAPQAFQMLESGRARTYSQSNMKEVDIAVTICPVSCMHKVAYHELVEMETARDVKSQDYGRGHMGNSNAHIPLNVARIDSDVNRKVSYTRHII